MISIELLAGLAAKHGLPAPVDVPTPWEGATSRVYPLGGEVVKVPFDRPDAIAAVEIDAAMARFARTLGVAAPDLVALDATREVVPVPVAVFERVRGVPLDRIDRSEAARAAWEAVGGQLAIIHRIADRDAAPLGLREFRQSPEVDPRPWVDELAEQGLIGATDARWLRALLDRIAPAALADRPLALCHGDVNAANVLVDAGTGAFRALIDWAGAGWLDPAWDFAGVPLEIVPWLLAGHRAVAPLPDDATAEARVLWCQVQTRLYSARSAPPDTPVDIDAIRRFAHMARLP